MSTPRILVLAAALFSTGAALAEGAAASQAASRAEVLADLEVYQRSGLATAEEQDMQLFRGPAYQAARARYEAMRRSPEFAVRVAAIAQRRGAPVVNAVQAH